MPLTRQYLSIPVICRMTGRIGFIEPYNGVEEDFETYCSRIEIYFLVNEIVDIKKFAAFFTLAGPKDFCLACDLLSPCKPEDSSFTVILDALKKHYNPKPIIYEHSKFYKCYQKLGEPVEDYTASLRALDHTCEFDSTLTEMLLDRFVMGLNNEKIQHTLLVEIDLTFDRAV